MYIRSMIAVVCVLLSAVVLVSSVSGDDIHDAVKAGDLIAVRAIVDSLPNAVNAPDEAGKTPLHHAVSLNLNDIARSLIDHGADIDVFDQDLESPLHDAVTAGNAEMVAYLLEQGTTTLNDTSATKHNGFVGGWTPLHLAALHGYPEIVNLLLDQGADIEARDGVMRTPLILTVEGGHMPVVEVLAERGADINAQAMRRYTALLWAARNGFEEMVTYLVDRKAAIEDDMLELAFQMSVVKGLNSLYQYVLEFDKIDVAQVAARDPGLILPASAGGSAEIVSSLAENGFKLDQTDGDGWTPLHYAVSEGRVDVLKYLVGQGLSTDVRNKKGESAFNLASRKGYREAAEYLGSSGADTSEPQFPILEGPYMGQEPPGDMPMMFAPGIVSGHFRAHSSIAFSPDTAEAYWTEMSPGEGAVKVSRREGNRWSYPETAAIERDPSFSPDGNRLYFINTRPFKPGEEPGGDPDVKEEYWYMERTESGWSEPVSAGDNINVIGVHWPCSVDKRGNLYFSEFSEKMYCSRFVDGVYQDPVLLTELFGNETLVGRSPFISPEGDYLLFSANDSLSISFLKANGTWTDRINLGDTINASHVNGSARVSPDGKYLFFVSAGRGRPWGIYWVSTSFIERMRSEHTAGE
ncbi:MAG TPA: ankyrin repeat domain-containing protein [Acidobacteriota bacterium]|nr:ankyrin repeat domain-containing protein [Acidobacteriota bacterium]